MSILSSWLRIPMEVIRHVIYPGLYEGFNEPTIALTSTMRTITVPTNRCLLITGVESYAVPLDSAGQPIFQQLSEVHCYTPPLFSLTKDSNIVFGGSTGAGGADLSDLRRGFLLALGPGTLTVSVSFTDSGTAGFNIHV